MAEIVDRDTGEITTGAPPSRMPPEIAGAIIKIMKATKQLGFDERNAHGGYSYVSIDKFLDHFRPLMADAGLLVMIDETATGYRDGPPNKDGKVTSWLVASYEVWIYHESGVSWGPLHRSLALPMTGPQTFGSGESYVQKRLMRALFMVPTGDKDADDAQPGELPAQAKTTQRANAAYRPARNGEATKANPAVAAPANGREEAETAFRRVRGAIRLTATEEECRAIYDTLVDEWGEAYAEDIDKVGAFNAAGVKDLKEHVSNRILFLRNPVPTPAT